ncbi:MAG: ROK family transcriptional regulator [Eisenbergiella sp.]
MMTKAGKETIKYINKQNILNFFRKKDEVRRAEIVEAIGLSAATVSALIQELVDEGYLIEKCYGASSGGRKPMLYNLNKNLSLVLTVKVTVKGLVIGVLNLSGEIIYHKEVIKKICNSTCLSESLSAEITEMRRLKPEIEHKITAVGYSIPGVLEYSRNRILYSAALYIEDFDLKDLTDRVMGRELDIYLFKDTDALVLNEYYESGRNERNMLYLYCDSGVGMSVMNRGKLLRIEGCGLEIGHTTIDIHGESCKCSSVGCVGTLLGEAPAAERLAELKGGQKQDVSGIGYREMIKMTEGGDPDARKVLYEQMELLEIVIVNVVNLFNPGTVIVGGPLAKDRKAIEWLENGVKQKALKPFTKKLNFQKAGQDENAALFGMANYILDRDFFKTLSV